jgi:hypothetical protein
MLAKIYIYSWIPILAIFMLLLLTGNITLIAWTAFGFIAFGMVFMGMIGVLPVMASHPETETATEREPTVRPEPVFGISRSAHSVRV